MKVKKVYPLIHRCPDGGVSTTYKSGRYRILRPDGVTVLHEHDERVLGALGHDETYYITSETQAVMDRLRRNG